MPYPPQPVPGNPGYPGFNPDLSGSGTSTISPDGTPVVSPDTVVNVYGKNVPYNEALFYWWQKDGLSDADRSAFAQAAATYYNRTPADIISFLPNIWRDMVAAAAANRIPLTDQLSLVLRPAEGAVGSIADTGGSGGPTTTTAYDRMSHRSAVGLLDQMMSAYMGRVAKPGEKDRFLEALRRQEQENPMVYTNSGGANSTTTRSGGFSSDDAALFAQEWATKQEGSLEYQAGTRVMDMFLKAVGV
jgi:hypothetical protein